MALPAVFPSLDGLPGLDRTTLLWWISLLIQVVALPGVVLPVLPGLVLLPVGAGLWCWTVGWPQGAPPLVLAVVVLLLGWGADALGMVLGAARLQASRWAYLGAAIGLLAGVLGLLPALPVGGPLLGALLGPWLGATLGEGLQALAKGAGLPLGRALKVGLAVVAGMLVSTLAQLVLVLGGIGGFVLLSWPFGR